MLDGTYCLNMAIWNIISSKYGDIGIFFHTKTPLQWIALDFVWSPSGKKLPQYKIMALYFFN
jgi:hypothetical protein